MCKGFSHPSDVVKFHDVGHGDTGGVGLLIAVSRRSFIFGLPLFRYACQKWINESLGEIPMYMFRVLFQSDWDFFYRNVGGLRVGGWTAILYFFAINNAPLGLVKMFWLLLLSEPRFDVFGGVSADSTYYTLYSMFKKMSGRVDILFKTGCFWNVIEQQHQVMPAWDVFNVWGCQAIYGVGMVRIVRYISDGVRIFDGDGNVVTVSVGSELVEAEG